MNPVLFRLIGNQSFMTPGDFEQYRKAAVVTTTTASEIKALEFRVPYDGGLRLKYEMYLTGSGAVSGRSCHGRIYHNNSILFIDSASIGTGLRSISRDIINLRMNDTIKLTVQLNGSDINPYVDPNIRNTTINTIENYPIIFTII